MNFTSYKPLRAVFLACSITALGACATNDQPTESYDGLVLQPESEFGAVYMRPGADLAGFDAYGITPCEVAFRKNWMRDQNSSRLDLSSRVTQKEVDEIKDRLGAECGKYFRKALEKAPPYPLVDSFSNGEAVLVIRPAIINLDIAAPDVQSAGRQRSYTTEAGQMTLLLELLDGTTGEILVRVVDQRRSMDTGRMQWTNSVTNQAEARRILGRWGNQLREGLDRVTGRPAAGK